MICTRAGRRDQIVAHVATHPGWVSIAKLAHWIASTFGIKRATGNADLRHLVDLGRLQRERTSIEWPPRYQYRIPPLGRHSGRTALQRRIEGGP